MTWPATTTSNGEGSTAAQRRALHRMGRSDWFIERYCATKQAAAVAIQCGIDEIAALKKLEAPARDYEDQEIDCGDLQVVVHRHANCINLTIKNKGS